MTRVDLHPEELLEREARGTLTDDERARLDAHLASCATCRFERLARADFLVEMEAGTATEVLLRSLPPERGHGESSLRPSQRAVLPRRLGLRVGPALVAALVSAGAAAGVVAGAARLGGLQVLLTGTSGADQSAPLAASGMASTRGARTVVCPPVVAAAPSAVPESAPSARAPVSAPSSRNAKVPGAATAAALFADANAARRRGDYAMAIRLYREVEASFPTSREAATARAVLGSVLLDRGDAAAALRHFDEYLADGGGAVREEALVGRATALGRLGRASEEAAAWSALLDRYPGSVHAERARLRLAALRGE